MVEKSYIDVNVFVYWLTADPRYGLKSLSWIKKIENSAPGTYMTSTLTVYETLVIIAGILRTNLKNREIVKKTVNAITSLANLKIIPLEQRDLLAALRLQEEYNLDYEDALHLAVAIRSRVTSIISNDRDFDKTPLKRIF